MKKLTVTLSALSSLLLLTPAAFVEGATISGQIAVSLTVNSTCQVSTGGSGTSWGALSFGTTTANLASNIDAEVTGTGGNGIAVTCSQGTAATLTIGSGGNDATNVRHLTNGAGTPTLLPYRLYSNSARTTEIAIGGTISVPASTGVAQLFPIYGRIVASEQPTQYPPAGSYTDTIAATLTWN